MSSSSGFRAQMIERLKGVFAIACIVTAGFYTYPPLLAFGIVACAADEFYRIARQQRLNMKTYAQESNAPGVGMAARPVVGPVTHRVARLHQGKRAAYVAMCVGISAAALASHEAMTFAALFFSFVLLVWLMATEVERKGTSSPATAAATDVKATSNSSAPSSSTAASASASDPSSPPPPSLLLHPSSALLSAQEFCAVLVLIAGIWYTAWMFSHGVLVMRHRSGFGAASASTASAVASAAAAAGGSTVGAARIIYVIFVTAGGENGGLFFGKLFGRHKLCRRLSPAKTVEGAFGQLGTSVAVSVIFRYYVAIDIPAGDSVILGLVLGFVGCVGDLFESFLKRSIGVKDAGHIIPGAGGMLDRMDGLIFNFPVMYAYLQWMHPITSGS